MISNDLNYTWRVALLTVSMLLVMVLGVYHETVEYLVGLWLQMGTGNYAHGFLVLGISLYLVVNSRRDLSRLTPDINLWAIPAIFSASLVWLVAAIADVESMQTVGLLLVVLAIVWAFLGKRVTWRLLFPILFIGYAIPIWFPLSPVLQDITATVVFRIARLIEIPAFLQENVIVLPAGKLSIEEACGGLNYLLAALTLSSLYAYMNYTTLVSRLIVVLVSAIAAIVSNIIRVFVVVYLGYSTHMQDPMIYDHLSLGWYIFSAMVILLIFVDSRIHVVHAQMRSGAIGADQAVQSPKHSDKIRYYGLLGACILLVVSGPALVSWGKYTSGPSNANISLEMPAGRDKWTGPVVTEDDWKPVYHGSISNRATYKKNASSVHVYIARYMSQEQGNELINGLNSINNADIWIARHPRAATVEVGDNRVLEQVLERDAQTRRLLWYWYRVAGVHTTSDYLAKVLQVVGVLTDNRSAIVIAIATDLDETSDTARSVLGDFAASMGPLLIEAGETVDK